MQFISQVDEDEESKKRAGACQLSVGARALMKHAHRSSEVRFHSEDEGRDFGAGRKAPRLNAMNTPRS